MYLFTFFYYIYKHFQILDNKNKSIVFYKASAQELLKDNAVHNINILTLSNNTAETLYQIWRQVYTPLLAAVSIQLIVFDMHCKYLYTFFGPGYSYMYKYKRTKVS